MSAEPTPIDDALRAYIRERSAGDDALLTELKSAAAAAGIPAIWISPEQARLMQVVLRLAGARNVLEIGTLAGYSAINMGRALLPGGRLTTVEPDPERAAFARSWIERAGLADSVLVHEGTGQEVLPGVPDGTLDACFFDADKTGLPFYVEQAARVLRPGGVLMVDNAFAFGQLLDPSVEDADVHTIRAVNEALARDARFHASLVAVGDGLWIGARA